MRTTLEELSEHVLVEVASGFVYFWFIYFFRRLEYVARLVYFLILIAYEFTLFLRCSKDNKVLWGCRLFGGILNATAIAANGWRMPVFSKRKRELSGIHKKGTPKSRVKYLCDVFSDDRELAVFSVGDVLLVVSYWIIVVKAISEYLEDVKGSTRRFLRYG